MQCINCYIEVNPKLRYEKNFDVIVTNDSTTIKSKESINVIGCSSKCLHEWYSKQEKVVNKDVKNIHRVNQFFGGAGV